MGEGADEGDEEDGEEDEEGEEVIPLNALPINKRYKMIGKITALNVWPWVSSSWWLRDEGKNGRQEERTQSSNSVKGKLAVAKRGLDTRMHKSFVLYLKLEMGIEDDEWTSPVFRTQVTVLDFLNINRS